MFAQNPTNILARQFHISDEIETHSISKALRYLNTTGDSWPTFDPSWNENDFDLETSLAAGTLQDGFDTSGTVLGPFIRLTVTRDYYAPRPATLLEVSRDLGKPLFSFFFKMSKFICHEY